MTAPLPIVVDRRGRFATWYWMALGGVLTLAAVVFMALAMNSVLRQSNDADRRNEDQKRYLLCVVDRTVAGVPRPKPGQPCQPASEAEKATARSQAANSTPAAQAFFAELDCRFRLALNNFPSPAAGAPCIPPAPGASPPPAKSPTTTTTTPPRPRSSAPAPPSPSTGGAGAPNQRPAVVLTSANPFEPPVLIPLPLPLPVTVPPVTIPQLPVVP